VYHCATAISYGMTIKDLKSQFLEYLEIEKNRSPKTIENYNHYLTRFINFAKVESPRDITEEAVRKYRLQLNRITDERRKPLKKVTQNYHVIALRSFLKYLAKRDIRTVPAEKIELGKQEEREVTFLEPAELERFLRAPRGVSLSDLRDRAILETLFSTGLRVSELCSLDQDDIDLARGEFSVRGKGSKLRLVFLSGQAKTAIATYLEKRSDVDEALFIRVPPHLARRCGGVPRNERFSAKGGSLPAEATPQTLQAGASGGENLRLTPRSIQRIIKKYAVAAGIVGKKITPHSLRHSFATDLLRNGADIRSVQALLGHSSVTTTQIYTHVTDKQLREVHQRFHGKSR